MNLKRIAKYVTGYLFGVTVVAVFDNYFMSSHRSDFLHRKFT